MIECSFEDLQNFYIEFLSRYTSCSSFSIVLNDDITDIEKSDRICSLTFVFDKFSGLF